MTHSFTFPCSCLLFLGLSPQLCAQNHTQPNVILILADDLGYGDLSCYGAQRVQTPNTDYLAQSGIRFTNTHATSSTSTPSRYGILTGQYPWRVQGTDIATGDAGLIISPQTHTLPKMFQQAGYRTAAVGKWHLGLGVTAQQDWNGTITPNCADNGFGYSFIMAATGDRVPCVFIENGKIFGYDPTAPVQVSYKKNFEGEPTGKLNPELLTKLKPSHGHDMSIVNGISRIGYMKGGGKALWKDEDIADVITQKACAFIQKNASHPFFLYFGTNDIHVPRVPNERFAGKTGMGARGDAILSFDYSVGEVINCLKKLGILENTIIIVTSDNGPVIDDGYQDRARELLGSHTPSGIYRGGKYSAFEAGTKVPFIIRWGKYHHPTKASSKETSDPKRAYSATSDALLSQLDLFASFAAFLNQKLPAGTAPDSRNYLDAFQGKTQKAAPFVVEQNRQSTLSLLTSDGYKYIEPSPLPGFSKTTSTELGNAAEGFLFYLPTDPSEQHNLIQTETNISQTLSKKLREARAR